MGIDRSTGTDTSAEQVEDNQPADQHPPRPPDKPGQEPEGAQSRLEAHKAKAAAKEQAAEKPAQDSDENKPSGPASSEQDSGYAKQKPESLATQESTESGEQDRSSSAPYEAARDQPNTSVQELAGERDESDEQPAAQRADIGEQPTSPEAQTALPGNINDRGAEQPNPEGTSLSDGVTVDDERAPADTTAAETSHPTPPDIEGARTNDRPLPRDVAESDDQRQPPDLGPPLDQPSVEPPDASSGTDNRAGAATANAETNDPSTDTTDSAPGQAGETPPVQEMPGTSPEIQAGTVDQQSQVDQHADDATERATPAEVAEGQPGSSNESPLATDLQPTADNTLGALGQAEGAAPAQEVPSTPPDLHGGTIDQPGTEGQPETADESTAATAVQPRDDTSTAPDIDPNSEASAEQDADATTDLPTKLASEEDDGTQVEDAPADKDKDSGYRLTVDGKPINEYLDPIGAAARDAAGDRPAIEEPAKPEDDKTSRPERLRRKFYEEVEDAHDVTSKAAQRGQEIFGGHPFGHPETRTSHEVAQTPREGVDAGDAAGALLVTGIVLGELLRWGYMKLKEGREHSDGGNR